MSTLRVEALEQPDGTAFVFNNKNLLINGGMNVWQRSTSESVSTDIYSTVDRFSIGVGGMGVFTSSRSTDVPSGQGFGYSTKWDCTTADASPAAGDDLVLITRLEGQNLQHLLKGTSSAKKVTLSFWVKSNKTGTPEGTPSVSLKIHLDKYGQTLFTKQMNWLFLLKERLK